MKSGIDPIIDKSQAKCLADLVLLYIRYACNVLHTEPITLEYAEQLYRDHIRGEIIGNPRVVASGVVYIAIIVTQQKGVFQQGIADALNVTISSVCSSYKKLKKRANITLPDDYEKLSDPSISQEEKWRLLGKLIHQRN